MTTSDEFSGFAPQEFMESIPGGAGFDGNLGDLKGDAVNFGLSEVGLDSSDLSVDGIGLGDVSTEIGDLADGNYDGALAEGGSLALGIGADALGVPGITGDEAVLDDILDGNSGRLEGDVAQAAIETGMGVAMGTVGSVLGPVGTIAGAAIGDFVGSAIAPSLEDAASDTYDTASNVVDDTVSSFEDAGDDLSDGNIFGAAGDVATGVFDDVGDVATGAVDLVGDAFEGVDDLATDTVDLVSGAADDVEDVASSAVDDVEDVASSVVDDVGDFFDSL